MYEGSPPNDQISTDFHFGQNYHFHENFSETTTALEPFTFWMRGEDKYDINNPIVTNESQQFARIVSKSTKQYGCAQAHYYGAGGGIHTVCIYTPEYIPGNERENIGIPLYDREFVHNY